ncbi:NAD/NADP-dependent glucose 1-dehydrogenase [Gluconacetobacter johannae DSM 13595]|uniref:Glucose 1-dehydrogenase n=1 Tax=Gluconacetobacter johannae TaxID=112140 RepID=A0A7W4J6F8_9PROT|nr:glucose 1-dehydrogenase [Gluconacetobacter johannae]MBB2175610.1 glucose 1-dehydrogenase [Gluconacetobacter johannae]GBQ86004.1 NAD/NADP-dependent glucose 1-dehydrogenase [Gluconacetobacter johannae DSM 13595]
MASHDRSRFAGRRVFLTGGGQGIGAATARAFACEGARIALNDLSPETLRQTMAGLPPVGAGPHLARPGDIAREETVDDLVGTAIAEMGGLDIVVCNAGIQIPSPSEAVTTEDFAKVLAVNVTGVMLCVRAALHHWLNAGAPGIVVVTSSVHQVIPKPGYLGYAASKGAIGNMVRTWALEYAARGIRVNAVAPGAIETPMNRAWIDDPRGRAAVSRHIPMRRPGGAGEVADAILFLSSDQASYVTGQTLFVDGGLTLYGDFQENWAS